jgi:RNA polymerase sigma-70 factor (ECF subfamily)
MRTILAAERSTSNMHPSRHSERLSTAPKVRAPDRWSAMTDEELLVDYRDHNHRRAFEELVGRFERELYSYLRRYTGDEAVAEDAFQATFLQLHLKCRQFEPSARLRPWLYTIATHQAIDAMRKNRRHKMVSLDRQSVSGEDEDSPLVDVLAGREVNPHGQLQTAERREWVRDAVSKLPEHLRSVVVMIYNQGLKYREVADVLKLPVGTIKSRLHAAVQKLGEAWKHSNLAKED